MDDKKFYAQLQRVAAKGLLARLWDEVEKRHEVPAAHNPFHRG